MHHIGDLPSAEQLPAIWSEIVTGVRSGRHPFHQVSLATVRLQANGAATPELRTVVLRDVSPDDWRFIVHTDRRSTKAADITANSAVSLLFYDSDGRWQVRVRGEAALHIDSPLSVARWASVPERSRRCYRTPRAPGSVLAGREETGAPAASSSDGAETFAVIEITASEVEALFLDRNEHKRLLWKRSSAGEVPIALEP